MTISKSNLVFAIFIVNALVAITSGLGDTGWIHTGIVRAVFIAAVLPILIVSIKFDKVTVAIGLVIIYLTISILTNTNVALNIPTLIGVIFSLLMYPIAYAFIYKKEHHEKLAKILILLLFIFGIHFIWAQVFQVGRIPYEGIGGIFYTGGGGVHQNYIIVYLLLFIPIAIKFYPNHFSYKEISAIILSLLPVFLIFRRGTIIAFVFGVIVYSFYNYKKSKYIKILFASSIIAFVIFPLYLSQIEPLLERRAIIATDIETIEEIGRSQEIIAWAPYWMEEKGTMHIFFGSELYDYPQLSGTSRSLHTDYATYLIGAGIFGFLLYFSILFFVIIEFRKHVKRINNKNIRKELYSVLLALMASYLVLSYSGQYYVISSLSTVMFLFGVINRYAFELSEKR